VVAGRSRRWTEADIPSLSSWVVLITGANTGLGWQTARVLAARGASVVLACRNVDKARQAADRITAESGASQVETLELDLTSLRSVHRAAAEVRSRYPQLTVLINNAGVMEVPYQLTEDGFELTLATNHLGPFAFTGLVLEGLLATPGSRVVTISSQGHADGVINFDDLQSENAYRPATAYSQSKLANLLFTYELDRRLTAAGASTIALAAHPGVVPTQLFHHRSRVERAALSPWLRPLNFWFAQDVRRGALPVLRAAADPAARGGEFYGPHRRFGTGYPVPVASNDRSHNRDDQARLWTTSERLTGVRYPFAPPPPRQ
jgi:NAD(P)-dependent dehydrogenase (short-subunit alcohol dehydrogenase family)